MTVLCFISAIWFFVIFALTVYGIYLYKKPSPVDVMIGFILSPALFFLSIGFGIRSM